MLKHLFTAAALGALSLGAVACGPSQEAQAQGPEAAAPPTVGVIVAQTEAVNLTTELSGRTSPFAIAEVRPQVNGIVKARLFEEGSYVRAGQPLYQIDSATYLAALSSAQAGLAQAQAGNVAAQLRASRYAQLASLEAVSKQDNEEARAAAQQGNANVAAQNAAVAQARINLGYTRVLAPISGRIGRSEVTAGALLTASQPTALATIQRLDPIYVDVTQSSAEMLKLRRELASGRLGASGGAEVRLILEDGSAYPLAGRLAFSEVTVDPGTGSVGLRASFPNPNGVLMPGMYVRATLTQGVVSDAILIPQPAISRDAKGQATAMVVGADGKAQPRVLTVGQTIGDRWLVTGGLKPGDRVIVEGLQKVRPGVLVRATPAALPAATLAQR